MTLLASTLFRAVGFELNDLEPGNEHVRWTEQELALYLTEAIASVASLKPTLFYSFVPTQLAVGQVQSMPGNYAELVDIPYNLNADGTPGERIVQASFSVARALGRPSSPRTRDGQYVVRSFTVHPENDTFFFVDPPVPPVIPLPYVMMLVQLAPNVVTAPTDEVVTANTVPELYQAALKDWMLYRAFAKDSESSDSYQKSQAHYNAFVKFVGTPPRDKDAVPVANTRRESAGAPATQ